ncbi:MAG: hypothetical protein Q9195_007341 [Heterodermia aff. obscurata]
MSGIELAGIVLAAFPLLISALEHYRETTEVLEDWWQIKKEYKKCKNEIKVQELAFENNLERFLLPLVVDDHHIAALIADPGGEKWKDAELEVNLKSRLPKSYELFLDTIFDINATMDALKDELGIRRQAFQQGLAATSEPVGGTVQDTQKQGLRMPPKAPEDRKRSWTKWVSRPNIEYQTQRVKFGFGRANRAKLFEEFSRSNGRLRELLDTNDNSLALRKMREHLKQSMINKASWKLWRHAAALHRLLQQTWSCHCRHMHRIYLLLQAQANCEHTEYGIYFFYAGEIVSSLPWTCIDVKAQRVLSPMSGGEVTLQVPQDAQQPPTPLQPQSNTRSALRKSNSSTSNARPKVNWDTSSTQSGIVSPGRSEGTVLIKDICSSIIKCKSVDENFDHQYLLRLQKILSERPQDNVTLEMLLKGTGGMRLDRRQRYKIAYSLVPSHLELYLSPWLSSHWNKDDIVFVKDPDRPGLFQVDQPYIVHDVKQTDTHQGTAYATSDRLLQTLGILLIELCFGTVLEDHEMRKQYSANNEGRASNPDLVAALDLAVALEWSRSVGGEAGELYSDAVQWCLRGQVAGAREDKWREELFSNVVLPLRSCYDQLYPSLSYSKG